MDVQRLKVEHAREDHNHRQGYYHQPLTTSEQLRQMAWHDDPHDVAGAIQHVEAVSCAGEGPAHLAAIGAATAIIVGCVLITPAGGFITPGLGDRAWVLCPATP